MKTIMGMLVADGGGMRTEWDDGVGEAAATSTGGC